jgi:hypothetical protein
MGRMSRRAGLSLVLGLSGVACRAPRPAPNIADADPTVKIAGIKQAAARRDRAALPALVEQLDSDDPAVRLFAIQALERIAGERFGYEYYLEDEQRKPAVARWREWLGRQTHEAAPAVDGK